jgi:hypothetical protein
MAVGFPVKDDYATGDVLTAAQMNDLSGTLNTVPSVIGGYAAAKNRLINADFRINQRSFTTTTTALSYGFDRWFFNYVDGTTTYSAQTFTAGAAPVAGYEGTNFARLVTTGQTLPSAVTNLGQKIEDVRSLANQTVTVSFWAKAATGTPKIAIELDQQFGSGGSTRVTTAVGQATITTSWVRYSATATVPSISGKTIGTNSTLNANLFVSAGSDYNSRTGSMGIQSNTFDIWGVQVEAGSIATPFQTASGTIAGELALAQRYYHRVTVGGAINALGVGLCDSTTSALISNSFPVAMRIAPTALEQSGSAADYLIRITGGTGVTVTAVPAFSSATTVSSIITLTAASGLTGGQAALCRSANANAYFGWSAEL